jgi:RNA 3'-terminal phosphate cyclase (ATP)
MLERMGLHVECALDAWGFYPKGGGQISARVHAAGQDGGVDLSPLDLSTRGALLRVRGRSVACSLPAHIAQRMGDRTRNVLGKAGLPTDIQPVRVSGRGPGAGIFLVAEYEHALAAFSVLGRPGKPSEKVAEEACDRVLAFHESDAVVDEHSADQLLLPMALARGTSSMVAQRITKHLRTNAYIIQKFLPARMNLPPDNKQAGEVRVQGGLR